MQRKNGITVSDDLTLSWQELLEYARELSLTGKVAQRKVDSRHFGLSEERRRIEGAFLAARESKHAGDELPPLAEWFYDNRFLFIEQIRQMELDKHAYRLPHMMAGRYAHYPRCLMLATVLLRHSAYNITSDHIKEFLESFQQETGLDSGELWAFVDMLKVALLRAVSSLARQSVTIQRLWRLAERFCSQAVQQDVVYDTLLDEYKTYLTNAVFIERAMVLLRESPHAAAVTEQISARLSLRDLTVDRLIKQAHTVQAKSILHISNTIASLRTLAKLNFETIFENISLVHRYLSADADYAAMDFDSREYYRYGVTAIAQWMQASEPAVARAAADLAARSGTHVGVFIVGDKRDELIRTLGRKPGRAKLADFYRRHMLLVYVGGTALSTVVSAALLSIPLFLNHPPVYGIWGFIISLIPIYSVAVTISNRLMTLFQKPAFLPKMALEQGLNEDTATMVVIPALVTSEEDGIELTQKMEVYWAANQQPHLYFTLLSDFKEDKNEIAAYDEGIIEKVEQLTAVLNQKYGRQIFFYAQRKRTRIAENGRFGGWERKRGALLDFCTLLTGETDAFVHVSRGLPEDIKYIITLDSDTALSRDAVIRMVGAMEHPLHRPVVNEQTNTVSRGYGIMQPRIGVDVVSAAKSRLSLVFSGKGGLDTYASAASDVYQDNFGTGIFTGKGIFNLAVYMRVLKDAFPENAILSHDLLEGSYLRCALLSDVVLMDSYPARYISWSERQHRWTRGDWQLLPWLGHRVRTKDSRKKNPLSGLAKYQIFDNLRRSLTVPLSFLVILLSQTAFYSSAFFWFVSGLLPLFIDAILDFVSRVLTLIHNTGKGTTLKDIWYETRTLFELSFYRFAFLPYETVRMLDAIGRTFARVLFTHKRMLQWVTAAEGEKSARDGVAYHWKRMLAAPILAAVLYVLSIVITHTFSIVAFAVFALWFFAPVIAYAISRPRHTRHHELGPEEKRYLEDIALKTWRFFEHFSEEEEYFWTPDNYQQSPNKGVAKRTSPTNVAYSMAATVCAFEMGFILAASAIRRLSVIVEGIEKAEKWRGHLYNWYDITNMEPLEPRYVSSVDSGNLACYLVVVSEALNGMLTSPFAARLAQGLAVVSREMRQEGAFVINDDIFNAVSSLDMIEGDAGSPLATYAAQARSYIDRHAGWARVLSTFPSGQLALYADEMGTLRERLRHIGINGFADAFHGLLELLSVVMEKASVRRDQEVLNWVMHMETALGESYVACRRLMLRAARLQRRIADLLCAMNFAELYDQSTGLFSIGYSIRQQQLSNSHYDLLASEARQTSFMAIAKGDVPEKHWFRLGRPLTVAGESRVLLSWGGTMFEYLMPLLIMKSYDYTLLGETYRSVVDMQCAYGEQRRLPWGISESGYYAFDLQMNYQYKAFGVPGLGMKSGLVRETVISPYATCLALPVKPRAALANLQKLEKMGASGRYGFFEAIDYTQARLHNGKKKRIVRSYMAHHQGMILAAIFNTLTNGRLQELFHSNTGVKATELLLKEKVPPRSVTMDFAEKPPEKQAFAEEIRAARTYTSLTQYPEAHFLSNNSYTVMLTQYGTGYSALHGNMISRWDSDVLRRAPGIHIYLKDTDTGAVWSAAFLPTCLLADSERVTFEPHKAAFVREVNGIETTLEVCVSPECNMEVRNLVIRNMGESTSRLTVTCAMTPVLCTERDFEAHPAFAELFVEAHAYPEKSTVFASRRGKTLCCALKAIADGSKELLTDRAYIYGRRNVFGPPACLAAPESERDVARAAGIRCGVTVEAGESAELSFLVAAADSSQAVDDCLSGVSGPEDVRRVFHLAWTHAQVEMRYLKLEGTQAILFQRIASRTVIRIPSVCAATGKPAGRDTLWKLGLSGDLPVIYMHIHDESGLTGAKTIAKTQEFLSLKGLPADLVFVYDGGDAYLCPVRDKLTELAQAASGRPYNRITPIARETLSDDDVATLMAAACLVLDSSVSLESQLKISAAHRAYMVFEQGYAEERVHLPKQLKAFDNGRGGYLSRGAEYCIEVDNRAPLPWSNLLVGEKLGSLVSAGGGGYTWADNARMTRLTPFRNDALTDVPGEGVLVRWDRTGDAFSAAPDQYAKGRYRIIHGFGYTVFERYGSINTRLTIFVEPKLPLKTGLLTVSNDSDREETLSVYYYAEPVLAATAAAGIRARFKQGRLQASSPFGDAGKAMFIAIPGEDVRCTVSAHEFFGVPGYNVWPETLKVDELSDNDGCGATLLALQARVHLKPGEEKTLQLLMGYGPDAELGDLAVSAGDKDAAAERLRQVQDNWRQRVGGVKVSTSSKAFDTLVNGWLLYQTYTSRLMGRTGYYQSGGAYGFRDQLQDVLAVALTNPDWARAHILRCAARQFIEGDVLHWWHEPATGVRTHISDDKLFLPYVACEFERLTGDMSLFDESVPYLESRPIPEGRHDLYDAFPENATKENLFMHCARAIDSVALGEHSLPLMGTGDWNDGMDKVGAGGRGESVWLAFFLAEVLRLFAALCQRRGDQTLAEKYGKQRDSLRHNIEEYAWDGEWYARAYFDDGTLLGSRTSAECRIDLISQAWAVISGAERAHRAYDAAADELVMRDEGVIRLLAPPFDKWEKDPGYIKNYLPGVRENGGQYSHAAAWFVIAAAKLRLKDDAMKLFQMMNPINHTRTAAGVEKYKGEPYVMAADVYYMDEHKGRAGWTWYTGTAGWMYQAAIIHLLGLHIERGQLSLGPCLPDDFGPYTIEYQWVGATYIIRVELTPGYQGDAWLSLEGSERTKMLPLDKTEGVHTIFACWQP
jgi:cyclic beta-1,2-glucan synthetase